MPSLHRVTLQALHKVVSWDQPELVELLLAHLQKEQTASSSTDERWGPTLAREMGRVGGPAKQTALQMAQEAGAARAEAVLLAWLK